MTPKRTLPPTQSEIEALEHGLYAWGDITSVARLKGISPGYLNKQLNPEESDHHSPYFAFVLHLWHCDQATDKVGDGYRDLTESLRRGWCLTREPEKAEVIELTRAVNNSMFDLLRAQVISLPYSDQMAYIDRAMRLLDDFKRDLQLNDIEDSVKSA